MDSILLFPSQEHFSNNTRRVGYQGPAIQVIGKTEFRHIIEGLTVKGEGPQSQLL
jgi:hypothetical protein